MPLLIAIWTGCYSPEDFSADYNATVCDKIYECYDVDVLEFVPNRGDDLESCYADRDEPTRADDDECAFDRKIAQTCVEETAGMACGDYTGGTNWPPSCDLVCGEVEE